jgi:hypothetical protein
MLDLRECWQKTVEGGGYADGIDGLFVSHQLFQVRASSRSLPGSRYRQHLRLRFVNQSGENNVNCES